MAAKKNNTGKKKVDMIGLDNKPINKEVQKDKPTIPKAFIK